MIRWRNYKTDPPYDAKSDEEAGYETDRLHCWFIYKYVNRNPNKTFVSYRECEFFDGVFTPYTSHMKTSPYPEDHIEVLWWCQAEDVLDMVDKSFQEFTRFCTNGFGDGPCKNCDCGS